MKFTDEDRVALYKKAQSYIDAESHSDFRNEVVHALDERADEDLYDRFYTSLAFGTAGMRGVIGGGTNRMNVFMVRKVTQGLADYITESTVKGPVVIAYDSRLYSDVFAKEAALVLCANGIAVKLYGTIHPVPMLSFAVRYLKAVAGIVITASHNPAKYNGYKVYWSDGGQVTPPHDIGIGAKVASVHAEHIRSIEASAARSNGLLDSVPAEVDEAYYAMVVASLRRPALFKNSSVKVAYTPLHGTGNIPVRTILERVGIAVAVVERQELPDGNFPTVSMPNPEDPQAMRLAIELAKQQKSDIVLGTDPDADRLGIAIPENDTKETYRLLSGNQIAILLCDYLINTCKESTPDTKKVPLVVKSLVTTDLVKAITERNGGQCLDVLTGFKYIAEKIAEVEDSSERFFLFGCEESYGYLSVPHIRDKDAVSTAVCAVEMMCHYATKGITLQQRLDQIYQEYGYHTETVLSFSYEGSSGKAKMAAIMADFRAKRVGDSFAGHTINRVQDLLTSDGSSEFPSSDVVILWFDSGEKLVIRPSGTEPKIKYYLFFTIPADQRHAFTQSMAERIAGFKAAL
jgi:phosphoglucomutase